MGADTRRATIVDVAAAAGVSTTTVSHVLTGRRPVAAATKARVEAVVADLDYRANASARHLRTERSGILALVVPDLTNPFNSAMAAGLHETVLPSGYLAVVGEAPEPGAPLSGVLRQLLDRGIDGMVLGRFGASEADIDSVAASGTALVRLGGPLGSGRGDVVRANEVQGMFDIVDHLVHRGYRRIAFADGPAGSSPGGERQRGYEQALRDAGLPVRDDLVVHTAYTREGGVRAAEALLAGPGPIDAIACCNDLIAVGVLDVLRARRIGVPGDIAVTGYDDIEAAELMSPALTTVLNPAREIGRTSARMLLDRLDHGYTGPDRETILAHRIVARDSA
ncbi:LacI family transcriptional regulator [Murinocardiopsis flavida]|uniref:LacI family transcriptional regulator n=1 Tax=Murinocardiopsis flavida TaxID=645275 RepID=A0A2P8DFM3_9ACTN|nr:LacI family DNA-binding transcriptional regulator [Murinocardiopsis flavida]PSK96013.1 LacI family transcriptional regulator [Murinocardiopsis flavida]